MTIIAELVKVLKKASNAYYGGGDAIMSDAEFDERLDELKELDPQNAFLGKVGAPANSALAKVSHIIPMGSLNKIKPGDTAAFNTWAATVSKTATVPKNPKVSVQLKLDGLSIELVYKNGNFVQAITRGDGNIGEDVTHTIKNAKDFPRTISVKDRQVSVRCEAMLYIAVWKKFFSGKANPRNAASGAVRRTDAKGSEHLACVSFDVLFADNGFKTEQDRIDWMKAEGFKTTPNKVCNSDQVEAVVKGIEDRRDRMPLEIDGAVIKLNDISEQEKLGEHKGRPYWARAWKFAAMGGHTILEGVDWAVGTQGTINPVAKVAPVSVGGTTIQNVTLHNMDEIDRLGVQIGDEVEVIRAGDVIPKIVRVVTKGAKRTKITIDACPACGAGVMRDGPKILCTNDSCEGTQFKKIHKWVKKRNIMYLGESNLKSLWDADVVKRISDLYLMQLSRMTDAGVGKGMATKILAEIEKSKDCSLADLMGSLSLDMLGRTEAANLVAQGVDTLGEWRCLTAKKIAAMPGYQTTKATRISQAIHDNWHIVVDVGSELRITAVKPKVKGGKLSGKSFCFTGTMKNPRKDLELKVEDAGGEVHSVGKGLTYLVIADPQSTSTKAVKAQKLGVKLISEDDFLKMV